jgi:hypothetical protein
MRATVSATQQSDEALGFVVSRQGTIIPVQKGPELDEFFLTFDTLGGMRSSRIAQATPSIAPPIDLPAQSLIGVRDFAEINASMAALTGVPSNNPQVLGSFIDLRQQLPSITSINSYLSSHQMAVTQLAIRYCDTLVEDNAMRAAFFPNVDFASGLSSSPSQDLKDNIAQALIQRMLGQGDASQPNASEVNAELHTLIDSLSRCANTNSCSPTITRTLAKASCAAVLGSAVVIVQ